MTYSPIIIVGAGPAGIGMAALLAQCALPALVVERYEVGASFERWPSETRFISPSFTGNFFGAVDLNAVTPDSSPAYGLRSEHPTGRQYARYLDHVVETYGVKLRTGTDILAVRREGERFHLATGNGDMQCRTLIWAGGEAQFPKSIPHTIRPGAAYKDLPQGHHVIVGGSESGMDAAYHLVKSGSSVTVIDPAAPWTVHVSDSSYGLSPYTFERLRYLRKSGRATLVKAKAAVTATHVTAGAKSIPLMHPAIDATGFDMQQSLAGALFHFDHGVPKLTAHDESTRIPNVYLVGPGVRHDKASFCFIYKYRQRFAVIAAEILRRWGTSSPIIAQYAQKGFLLDDLSCCSDECAC